MEKCDVCQKEIQEFNGELLEGKCLEYKDGDEVYHVIRCDKCFETKKSLSNYKKTEVFSRVCGYIRPVQQWHKGKVQEFGDRKVFKQPPL